MQTPPPHGPERARALQHVLEDALEASEYALPGPVGLLSRELQQIAADEGFGVGEASAKIRELQAHGTIEMRGRTLRLSPSARVPAQMWWRFTGDPRNPEVADVLWHCLQAYARSGGWNTTVGHERLYVEADKHGYTRTDAALALRALEATGMVGSSSRGVAISQGRESSPPPSDIAAQFATMPERARLWFPQIYARVADVVRRRTDGREVHTEPLDAFAMKLDQLGHGHFGSWWRLTVAELRTADPNNVPLTSIVLCAALAEAALCFSVDSGRRDGRTFVRNIDAEDPKHWNFNTLASSAASGPDPIVDQALRQRLDKLNLDRQRIHVGYLIKNRGQGRPVPDSRPEEARAARETLDQLVREILSWVDRVKPAAPVDAPT